MICCWDMRLREIVRDEDIDQTFLHQNGSLDQNIRAIYGENIFGVKEKLYLPSWLGEGQLDI